MFTIFLQLIEGLWVTVQIAVLAAIMAIFFAFLAGLLRLAPSYLVRSIIVVYVEIFRGTSLLVQLFWLYFVLPHFGVSLDPFTVAVVGLGLNWGAYGSEIVRGAVVAVSKGQYEAATALNMSPMTRLLRIILPQAAIAMLPPFGNLFIELLKGTALVSLITLNDLTFKAVQMNQATFRTTEIFVVVLVLYFIVALLITAGMRWTERRASRWTARGTL